MKPVRRLLLAAMLSIIPAVSMATEHDALWSKVTEQFNTSESYAAKDIRETIHFEMNEETRHTVIQLALGGWKNGQAYYQTISVEPASATNKKPFRFDEKSKPALRKFFASEQAPKRTDNVMLGEKNTILFEGSNTEGKDKFQFQIWVDPDTGAILQNKFYMTGPAKLVISALTSYAVGQQGISLPSKRHIDLEFNEPFRVKGTVDEELLHWEVAPDVTRTGKPASP
ncbi:hypothetical protein [Undibacterium luofuense]|uniref:Outer membrane lipoprotein-sorting protein n=1 Tax=Undibacterium luofuense TaxID=2828733 RepID=A0A941DLT2_9BURK|nr:hypothetical protein [Undibacterium luofuense]MBR7781116.1 hypothetical protein [Undibacterium luofuense]